MRSAYDQEHDRELQKHDRRPSDPPHRLDRPITTAMEVAAAVRSILSINDAAKLIEQYAATVAEGARLDLAIEYDRRIAVAVNSPLVPR